MKISNDFPAPELDPKKSKVQEGTQRAERTEPVKGGNGEGDSVSISSKAQELLKLASKMANVPEARSERLEAIRLAVAEGSYLLSSEAVADRMLQQLAEHPSGI